MVISKRYILIGAGSILITSACFQQQEDDTRLTQVGYFYSEKLRGFTYYLENPTKKAIRSLCSEKKVRFVDKKTTERMLKIAFFDDQEHTPNITITWAYDWPESADSYLVAKCHYGSLTEESGLIFHQEIPE